MRLISRGGKFAWHEQEEGERQRYYEGGVFSEEEGKNKCLPSILIALPSLSPSPAHLDQHKNVGGGGGGDEIIITPPPLSGRDVKKYVKGGGGG